MSELVDAIVSLKEEEALEIVRYRLEAGEEPMSLVEEARGGITIEPVEKPLNNRLPPFRVDF